MCRNMVAFLMLGLLYCGASRAQSPILFETHVEPIFKARCSGCHWPDSDKLERSELVLANVAGVLAGGKSGEAIIPGNADESALVQMIEWRIEPEMPPKSKFEQLPAGEIAIVRKWINEGAESTNGPVEVAEAKSEGSDVSTDGQRATVARESAVGALAFSPDGSLLARGGLHTVLLFAVGERGSLTEQKPLSGHAEMARALAFSPDGKRLAVGGGKPGRNGEIKIWDVEAGTSIHSIEGHKDNVLDLAFSPDGERLASASYDKTVKLWNAETGALERTISNHVDAVYGVAFSPDGTYLASASGDRTVKIWNAATGERVVTLSDSTDAVLNVAFSPDGQYVAAGAADKMIRVWDVKRSGAEFSQTALTAGVLAHATFAHNGRVLDVVYSRDGKRLYSTSEDRVIKAWDAETMTEAYALKDQPDWVTALAVSPDGAQLVAGRYDASTTVYRAGNGEPLSGWQPRTLMASADEEESGRKKITSLDVGAVMIDATIPPSITSLSPSEWRRGSQFELSVRGMNLEDVEPLFTDPRIQAIILENIPGEIPEVTYNPKSTGAQIFDMARPHTVKLSVTIPEDVATGRKEFFFTGPGGLTNGKRFTVTASPAVHESEPNDAREQAQALAYPARVSGRMAGETDVDQYRVQVEAGTEIVFALRESRFDAVLTLRNNGGRVMAKSDADGEENPELGYRAETAGEYVLAISNQSYGKSSGYELHVGEFPYVEWVDRLGASAGSPVDVAVRGFNIGAKESITVDPPDDVRRGTMISLPVPHYEGNPIAAPRLAVDSYPEAQEQGDSSPENPDRMIPEIPFTVSGAIEVDGEADYYGFSATAGERIVLEVAAARLGSPLDSVVEVLDSEGNPVERGRVRCVSQTFTTLNERDARSAGFRLDTWSDFEINDYLMIGAEIVRVRSLPDYADEDLMCHAYWGGQRQTYFGTTPEFHAVGEPVYKVEVHPPGTEFAPNGMPVFDLFWRNDDGAFDGRISGDSYLEFVAPEDGAYLVRIADAKGDGGPDYRYRLHLRALEPDFDVVISPYRVNVHAGSSVPLHVRVQRRDGFSRPVNVQVAGFPEGVSIASDTIPAGENTVELALSASGDADSTPFDSRFTITATAEVGGDTVTRNAWMGPITVVKRRPDLVVRADRARVALQPGKSERIGVTLDRFNGFTSRVPIDVLNLPFGVRVLDTGLNGILVREGEYTRSMEVYAEPWVEPMSFTAYVQARIESRSPGRMLFLSQPITITISNLNEPAVAQLKAEN